MSKTLITGPFYPEPKDTTHIGCCGGKCRPALAEGWEWGEEHEGMVTVINHKEGISIKWRGPFVRFDDAMYRLARMTSADAFSQETKESFRTGR